MRTRVVEVASFLVWVVVVGVAYLGLLEELPRMGLPSALAYVVAVVGVGIGVNVCFFLPDDNSEGPRS